MPRPETYTALPTMREFHECPAKYRCIVGPVGSGKSSAAVVEICAFLPKFLFDEYQIKRTRWVVVRNTYRELMDTTVKTIMDPESGWFPGGDYHKKEEVYTIKWREGFEAEIMFRACDRADDLKKFKSLEITGFLIDESIEVPEDIKDMLKNRVGRYPRGCPVKFGIEITNPPDAEHPTYYKYKWNIKPPGPVPSQKPLEDHIGFWQPPGENRQNLNPTYYEDLIKAYAHNPEWIKRYVEGKPGVSIKGKPVFNNFIYDLHVAKSPLVWSKGSLFAGWDNTGNTPACVVVQMPSPRMVQVLRTYHSERMGIVDFAKLVVADRNTTFPNATWTDYGDPAGWAQFSKSGGQLTSNSQLMEEEAGVKLLPSEQNWSVRRETVEMQLGTLVAGQPGLSIDPSCIRLINGFIGGYCYPQIGTTGVYKDKPTKNQYSHIHDALQYVLVMLVRHVIQKTNKRGVSLGTFGDRTRASKEESSFVAYGG